MTLSHKLLIGLFFCALVAWAAGPSGRFLVALGLLLFGPGYLIERHLPRATPYPLFERPALWLPLSLSATAMLYQWATAVGLHLTPAMLQAVALLCGAILLWSIWRGKRDDTHPPRHNDARRSEVLAWGGLLLILMLTLWTRFVQIRDLALPAWVDSVHHALLVQVAAEQGQVPYSLQPYVPVENLPYHWGYHVVTAALMQLSEVDLPTVMLWEGQILNSLHVLTSAALATYLWRRPLAGVVAGLIVGLISIMPAYYVTWGRYTQLTGLLFIPALAIAWHIWLRTRSSRWLVCLATLLAGLSMVHFRVLLMALCLLLVIGALWALNQPRNLLLSRLRPAIILAALSIALAAPWMWILTMTHLSTAAQSPGSLVSGGSYVDVTEGLVWAGQNRLLVALALAAVAWGLVRRVRTALVVFGWVLGLVVLANPWFVGYLFPLVGVVLGFWGFQQRHYVALAGGGVLLLFNPLLVRIPYTWLVTNDVVAISLFLPLGVLIGGGVCLLFTELRLHLPQFWYRVAFSFGVAALAIIAVRGAWQLRDVVNNDAVFITQSDVDAIAWVAEHTPDDARFLINATPWFPTVDRGTDGGYWLLPLTGRWTNTPPSIYTYGPPDYVQQVEARSRVVADFTPGAAQEQQLFTLIDEQQIDYIYLRAETGPLAADLFADEVRFEMVYEQDGVTILAVHRQS